METKIGTKSPVTGESVVFTGGNCSKLHFTICTNTVHVQQNDVNLVFPVQDMDFKGSAVLRKVKEIMSRHVPYTSDNEDHVMGYLLGIKYEILDSIRNIKPTK